MPAILCSKERMLNRISSRVRRTSNLAARARTRGRARRLAAFAAFRPLWDRFDGLLLLDQWASR
jgi:hypothetical protein